VVEMQPQLIPGADPDLVQAYRSKIAKEQAGKDLAFDPERQHAIRAEVTDIISGLDRQLELHADPWVCGTAFTLADLVWGISLYRMQWLGLASLWAEMPRIIDYCGRVYRRPSIWEDVIRWPSPMPPSPHTADIQ